MGAKREKNKILKMPQVGVLWRPSFLSKGFRLPKKLNLRRTPLAKSGTMFEVLP